MKKTPKAKKEDLIVKKFSADVKTLLDLPVDEQYQKLFLEECPFDSQLITLGTLYRKSRVEYLRLGGSYKASVVSTMRSLSTHDLFKNEIEFTPLHSEMIWLYEHLESMPDAFEQVKAIKHFHDISIFHEQNHRIIWKLLPPAPTDKSNLRRYLNFAESLVVSLDLALADQVDCSNSGLSKVCERLSLFYRPAGPTGLKKLSRSAYRQYLLSVFCATYYCLERIYSKDVLKAVNYVLPKNKKYNRLAVRRGLELNQDFTEITNPQWQEIYWQSAAAKLGKIHQDSKKQVLFLSEDPLDLGPELKFAQKIFAYFEV